MPKYKLTYFDSRGRGEPCRLLFVLAGQEFEDVRIPFQEWSKFKTSTPFGQLPLLEIDGQIFSQSNALSCYLAREFGYYGKTNLESLEIDQVVFLINDFVQEVYKFFFQTDEQKKAELKQHFVDVEMPKYLGFFEKLLEANATGYFVGNSLTLADLVVYDLVSDVQQLSPDGALDKFPRVKEHLNLVESNERIRAYIVNRKSTTF
ncbi:hypothetical protein BsWGS_25302 [Bradybaena similaris]